jgi:rubrerythrin
MSAAHHADTEETGMKFKTIDEVLDFAIKKEEEAAELYASLAEKMSRPGMREAFLDFSKEEQKHKDRLLEVKSQGFPDVSEEQVDDLKVTEMVEEPEVDPNMTYAEILRFAMKAEKSAFKMYTGLAALAPPSLAGVFQMLALEEAKHKLRFEIEYEDHVLEGV